MQRNVLLSLAFLFIAVNSSANTIDSTFFKQKEQSLINAYSKIGLAQGKEKKQLEIDFQDSLISFLNHQDAERYTFDSLKNIGKVISDDKKLIVYTWNIPQEGGFNNYYCIVQYHLKKEKKFITTPFKEKIGFLNQNQQEMASPNLWPGVLYYKCITTKYKGTLYYTLLGFDFNNLVSNRKVIEVLVFDELGHPFFKPQAFFYKEKTQNRVVFEYTERVQMMLEYNKNEEMIIFDHLSPQRPSLEGQFQFYGPDFSHDGLKFEEGKWIHESDIVPSF